jgi:hypothetical protein
MSDAVKSIIRVRRQISLRVFVALLASMRGVYDFAVLSELDGGQELEVRVWRPVAALYETLGFPSALLPHAILIVVSIWMSIAATKKYLALKREIGADGIAEIEAIDKAFTENSHLVGRDWGSAKKTLDADRRRFTCVNTPIRRHYIIGFKRAVKTERGDCEWTGAEIDALSQDLREAL